VHQPKNLKDINLITFRFAIFDQRKYKPLNLKRQQLHKSKSCSTRTLNAVFLDPSLFNKVRPYIAHPRLPHATCPRKAALLWTTRLCHDWTPAQTLLSKAGRKSSQDRLPGLASISSKLQTTLHSLVYHVSRPASVLLSFKPTRLSRRGATRLCRPLQ
jgi:hypothetical protein